MGTKGPKRTLSKRNQLERSLLLPYGGLAPPFRPGQLRAMTIVFVVLGTLFGAAFLWLACSRLEESTHRLAQHYGIPDAVKGSVLLAISSSMPELVTAMLAFPVHGDFELGMSAIIGSAIYNILVISGVLGVRSRPSAESEPGPGVPRGAVLSRVRGGAHAGPEPLRDLWRRTADDRAGRPRGVHGIVHAHPRHLPAAALRALSLHPVRGGEAAEVGPSAPAGGSRCGRSGGFFSVASC